MNAKSLAELLNGRQYGNEIEPHIKLIAEGSNLVVVFGASDDLMEFRGAINEQIDCYDGGTAYFSQDRLLHNECPEDDCPYFEELKKSAKTIEAVLDEEGFSWVYKTEIPHETFIIYEDGDTYCRGIVFSMEDLK